MRCGQLRHGELRHDGVYVPATQRVASHALRGRHSDAQTPAAYSGLHGVTIYSCITIEVVSHYTRTCAVAGVEDLLQGRSTAGVMLARPSYLQRQEIKQRTTTLGRYFCWQVAAGQ